MTKEQITFVEKVGWVFEHSPWVAERASSELPFPSIETMHAAMVAVVRQAAPAEQLALIQAHPDLGARAKMSDASVGEQAGAGLNQLTPDEFATLNRLNAEYKRKFAFPFIYAVKGSTKHAILQALEARLDNTPAAEHATALEQIANIAWFRLSDTFKESA